MKRRSVALLAITVAVLGATAMPVAAAWTMPGLGSGGTRGGRLQPPIAGPTTVTSAGAHLTWSAPSNGLAPAGYLVSRDGVTVCTTSESFCDDKNLAPGRTYSYLVRSTTGSYWVSATQLPLTATTAAGGFTLSALSPTTVTAGVGVTFTVSATYGAGATDAAYAGVQQLTISSSAPASPGGTSSGGAVSATFVAGVATKIATKVYGSGAQTLTVSDGFRTGSLAITVKPAAATTMELISSTDSTVLCGPDGHINVPAGQPLSARVATVDAYGNLTAASNLVNITLSNTGSGSLSKTALTIASGSSVSSLSFTLTMPAAPLKSGTLSITAAGTTLSTRCGVN